MVVYIPDKRIFFIGGQLVKIDLTHNIQLYDVLYQFT